MEFDDEIDHSILFTDDPTIRQPTLEVNRRLGKKSITPNHWSAAQMASGKGSRAWSIIQMSWENLRGAREFLGSFFFGWGKTTQKMG